MSGLISGKSSDCTGKAFSQEGTAVAALSLERTAPHGSVSVIVPTYQEAENLQYLVPRITEALNPRVPTFEILIIDDDSRDGTEAMVARLQNEGYPVRLIVRMDERGLSSAVLRGFQEAQGDILVCMDADLSHPPEALPQLLDSLADKRADFVIGSRYIKGGQTDANWGAFRWFNSKVATLLAWPLTTVTDPMSGFFALPRKVFDRACDLNPIGYKIALELIVKCACQRIEEVPIHFIDRRLGTSKLTFQEQLKYLRHVKRLFDYKYGPTSRFLQFCVVGSSGVIVDLFVYALLLSMNLPVAVGRAVAILVAMTTNFFLNRTITFNYSRQERIFNQYYRFVATCSLGGILNWTISVTLTYWVVFFDENKYLAALVGILIGTFSNFLISSRWVFGKNVPPWCGSQERRQ